MLRGFSAGSSGGNSFTLQLDATTANTGSQSLRSRFVNTPTLSRIEALEQCNASVERLKESRAAFRARGIAASEYEWRIQNARVVCQAFNLTVDTTSRDRAMADNVQWILDQNSGAKIVLWAHNGHVSASGAYSGYVPMGSYLWEKYGTDMFIFGFAFNRGGFQAIDAASGTLRAFNVPHHRARRSMQFIHRASFRSLPSTFVELHSRDPFRCSGRGCALVLYDERIASAFFGEGVLPDAFDAMLFVENTTRGRPIQ